MISLRRDKEYEYPIINVGIDRKLLRYYHDTLASPIIIYEDPDLLDQTVNIRLVDEFLISSPLSAKDPLLTDEVERFLLRVVAGLTDNVLNLLECTEAEVEVVDDTITSPIRYRQFGTNHSREIEYFNDPGKLIIEYLSASFSENLPEYMINDIPKKPIKCSSVYLTNIHQDITNLISWVLCTNTMNLHDSGVNCSELICSKYATIHMTKSRLVTKKVVCYSVILSEHSVIMTESIRCKSINLLGNSVLSTDYIDCDDLILDGGILSIESDDSLTGRCQNLILQSDDIEFSRLDGVQISKCRLSNESLLDQCIVRRISNIIFTTHTGELTCKNFGDSIVDVSTPSDSLKLYGITAKKVNLSDDQDFTKVYRISDCIIDSLTSYSSTKDIDLKIFRSKVDYIYIGHQLNSAELTGEFSYIHLNKVDKLVLQSTSSVSLNAPMTDKLITLLISDLVTLRLGDLELSFYKDAHSLSSIIISVDNGIVSLLGDRDVQIKIGLTGLSKEDFVISTKLDIDQVVMTCSTRTKELFLNPVKIRYSQIFTEYSESPAVLQLIRDSESNNLIPSF